MKNQKSIEFLQNILMGAVIAVFTTPILAKTENKTAMKIMKDLDKYHQGFEDSSFVGKMFNVSKSGKVESEKIFKSKVLEDIGNGSDSLLEFEKPGTYKGILLLSLGDKEGEDVQYIRTKSKKALKKVSAANKDGSFLGTEFSYEDFKPFIIEKYWYTGYKKGKCPDGTKCHVITAKSRNKSDKIPMRKIFVSTDGNYLIKAIDFYNRRNQKVKHLKNKDYKKYNSKTWAASFSEMLNVRTKRSTRVLYSDFKFGKGVSSRKFSPHSYK